MGFTLTVAGVLLGAVAWALGPAAASPAAIDHATTVRAGQTLSEVAALELPSLPLRQAITELQLVNSLNSSQVHAGQTLLIPRLP
ncbi:MAG TPA: LysM peptidoglycan-binding domain-containing protein [Dermatophilaceae bacterium]|nr:LysM peptidoglycan-binding domain-containing protein [Dermatophilaceae bacterium]